MATSEIPRDRLDKWLWHARFFKTRSLATKQVAGGHVRVNGDKVHKPSVQVGAGDVLTFATGDRVRIIEIVAIGMRRGPAPEAQALYIDNSPPPPERKPVEARVGGRPTGKDRRMTDALKGLD